MGHLHKSELERILTCMKRVGLPVFHPKVTTEMIENSFAGRLKHGNGALRLPMPVTIRKARIINEVDPNMLTTAARVYIRRFSALAKSNSRGSINEMHRKPLTSRIAAAVTNVDNSSALRSSSQNIIVEN